MVFVAFQKLEVIIKLSYFCIKILMFLILEQIMKRFYTGIDIFGKQYNIQHAEPFNWYLEIYRDI